LKVVTEISAVQIFRIPDKIEYLVTTQFDSKPIKLFQIFKHLFKRNNDIYRTR